MNKDNLKKLIKVMKEKKYGFVMGTALIKTNDRMNKCLYKYKLISAEEANICGTAACIAGHCCLIDRIAGPEDFLEMSQEACGKLFFPRNKYVDYLKPIGHKKFITRARAIRVLENLLETGEVDWSVT